MDEATRAELLAQFAAYLDAVPDRPEEPSAPAVDLHTLFTELAALKNEVKLESRQVKGAVDGFKELFALVEEQNRRLGRELEECRGERGAERDASERPLLLALIELRDRLEQGLALAAGHRPRGLARLPACAGRELTLLAGLAEGQAMTLRRLDQLLADYAVEPVAALGQPLDPHTMRVSAVEQVPGRPAGEVVRELRRGYVRAGRVLRTAEVVVNKAERV